MTDGRVDAPLGFVGVAYGNLLQERERRLLALLARYGVTPLAYQENPRGRVWNRLLAPRIHQMGARPEHIAGIDLLADRIGEAHRLCPQAIQLRCGSAAELPFPDETVDLVPQSTIFTSVLDSGMKQRIAAEMLRRLQ